MYDKIHAHEPVLCKAFENKEKEINIKDPACDGSDIYKRCLDALSYTFQHPSSGVSVRSVAYMLLSGSPGVCAFRVHM